MRPLAFAYALLGVDSPDAEAFYGRINHLHGIVVIVEATGASVEATLRIAPTTGIAPRVQSGRTASRPARRAPGSVGAIVGQIKSIAMKRINRLRGREGEMVWQRYYYDRIPRNEGALNAVRNYIRRNPAEWAYDPDNPDASRFLGENSYPDGWLEDLLRKGRAGR